MADSAKRIIDLKSGRIGRGARPLSGPGPKPGSKQWKTVVRNQDGRVIQKEKGGRDERQKA
jgi:hypothetical protein